MIVVMHGTHTHTAVYVMRQFHNMLHVLTLQHIVNTLTCFYPVLELTSLLVVVSTCHLQQTGVLYLSFSYILADY